MSRCCGGGRAPLPEKPPPRPAAEARPAPDVGFVNRGLVGLTVRGAVTGRIYRFLGGDGVVMVDARDAPGMGAVPGLRRWRG